MFTELLVYATLDESRSAERSVRNEHEPDAGSTLASLWRPLSGKQRRLVVLTKHDSSSLGARNSLVADWAYAVIKALSD